MNFDDIMFARRIRQNHALEHATITVLSGMVPDLSISARSSSSGFIILGDMDLGLLRRALDEALRRLQAGEASLAIHPNCGTNHGKKDDKQAQWDLRIKNLMNNSSGRLSSLASCPAPTTP